MNWALWYPVKSIKCKQSKADAAVATKYLIIPLLTWYACWSDTKSNVKLGGFQSQLQVSWVSSHTEELWYNETVCLGVTIYIYIYKSCRQAGHECMTLLSFLVWLEGRHCLWERGSFSLTTKPWWRNSSKRS